MYFQKSNLNTQPERKCLAVQEHEYGGLTFEPGTSRLSSTGQAPNWPNLNLTQSGRRAVINLARARKKIVHSGKRDCYEPYVSLTQPDKSNAIQPDKRRKIKIVENGKTGPTRARYQCDSTKTVRDIVMY